MPVPYNFCNSQIYKECKFIGNFYFHLRKNKLWQLWVKIGYYDMAQRSLTAGNFNTTGAICKVKIVVCLAGKFPNMFSVFMSSDNLCTYM